MGINKEISVSVLMTAYNAENYVKEAIQSILEQTYSDFEFVIINDGSTDKTLEIIQSFDDKRIRIINEGKFGYYKAKRRLIEEAKGKYIAIMDADDISDKNRFEAEVDFLDKNSSFGLVGTNAIWIDKDNKPFGEGFNFGYSPEELKCRLLFHNCFVHTSVLIRKYILDANHLNYKELAGEDFDMWIQIAKHSKIYNIPKPMLRYRIHQGNMIHSNWYKLDDGLFNIIKEQLFYYFQSKITNDDVEAHYSLINFNRMNQLDELPNVYEWLKKIINLNNEFKVYNPIALKKVLSERMTKKLMRMSANSFMLTIYLIKCFNLLGFKNIFFNINRSIYIVFLSMFRIKIKNV